MRLPSYAKINLCLHVLGKREDNYHEIETIFQQISLYDDIIFRSNKENIQVSCDHPDVPVDESNLCYKAAQILRRYSGSRYGCIIDLHKRIPVAAGLGGGSSNAAVTLLGLNILWGLCYSKSDLVNISTYIGSDVPFFIEGGKAFGTGRGDLLTSVSDSIEFWCIIISPPFKISSEWAYKSSNFSLTKKKKSCKLYGLQVSQPPTERWYLKFRNDLESLIFKSFPQLKWIRDELEKEGALLARVSGSGPCIFGLFNSKNKVHKVKKLFDKQYAVYVARPIKWGYDEL